MSEQKKRERMVEYFLSFLGVPYYWGGDDSFFLDCSGGCIEAAKSVGLLPHVYDNNAHGLWEKWRRGEREPEEAAQPGDFVFYFKDDFASHIEMALNESQVIGASGGGRPQFDLYEEALRDPILNQYYKELSRGQFYASCMDDFSIRQLKRFLIEDEAIRRNAFVKIRPIDYRPNAKIVNPFYNWEI